MARKEADDFRVTPSSGNVFADLGVPESEEELAKADLAACIVAEIKARRLTQVAAAERMGIDQPKVSALMNGKLASFSSDRLMHLLNTLDQDLEILVSEKPRTRTRARIRVRRLTRPFRLAKTTKALKEKSAMKRSARRRRSRKTATPISARRRTTRA